MYDIEVFVLRCSYKVDKVNEIYTGARCIRSVYFAVCSCFIVESPIFIYNRLSYIIRSNTDTLRCELDTCRT